VAVAPSRTLALIAILAENCGCAGSGGVMCAYVGIF
jgi:hypothetical protein